MDIVTTRRVEKLLQWYIGEKIPPSMRSSVRLTYKWEAAELTLCEERPDPSYREWVGQPIVRFRFSGDRWHVLARAKDGTWGTAEAIPPHADFERQLEQVEVDRAGIFWTA
ncbi:DUF3024 domain-containing protein [Cohnella fermenti]|uniref:DUF3024 domain-containing protein n=1 Tax=Cohnella fermenti TaxID=2565925 RepID=A0A4S4BW99_9BACL|nr:DUF3024 domain-containing protein [Cohnella fermenti]THF79454.1 DUF3024 domain-containing protein [Cohnella fermenti]